MKYFLGVLTLIKNEGNLIKEWLNHYKNLGIDIFYLYDNDSNDNFDKDEYVINFIKSNNVVLKKVNGRIKQEDFYNEEVSHIKHECKWLLILDIDEFLYSPHDYNLKEKLKTKYNKYSQVVIPWFIFSAKPNIHDPKSVVKSNLYRIGFNYDKSSRCKSIIKTNKVIFTRVHIHRCHATVLCDPKMTKIDTNRHRGLHRFKLNDTYISNSDFVINHYRYRSYEFYFKVKLNRIKLPKNKDGYRMGEFEQALNTFNYIYKKARKKDRKILKNYTYNQPYTIPLKYPNTTNSLKWIRIKNAFRVLSRLMK